MKEEAFWWEKEGYPAFKRGKDHYPCPGQVVQHYRLRNTVHGNPFRQCDLAKMLGISERAVWAMENRDEGLDSFQRRIKLTILLDIPVPLLKLAPISPSGTQRKQRPGQIIKAYRMQKKDHGKMWTQANLANLLGVTEKSVRSMENHDVGLDSISRREMVIKILDIPPPLLGLDVLHFLREGKPTKLSSRMVLSQDMKMVQERLTEYQGSLPSYWDAHYTGSISLEKVEQSIQVLHGMIAYVNQAQQEHIRELLYQYHQIALDVARDQGNLQTALAHADLAILLVEQMEKKHFLATALYRRGLTYFDQGNLPAANHDLQQALPLVQQNLSSQWQGMIFMEAGRFQAYLARGSIEQLKAEKLVDRTQTLIQQRKLEEDESYVKLDQGRYALGRAAVSLALRRPHAALEHLDDAERLIAPQYLRRHAYMTILRARAYFVQKQFDWATDLALDALRTCLEIHSASNIADIARLYDALTRTSFGNAPTLAQLGLLLRSQRSWNP